MGYLSGWQSSVELRGQITKLRIINRGVPYGSILYPLLFIFYISRPSSTEKGVSLLAYTNDCSLCFQKDYSNRHLLDAEVFDFKYCIQHPLQLPLDRMAYQQALNTIHRDTVKTFVNPFLVDGVPGVKLPQIPDENHPHHTCTT